MQKYSRSAWHQAKLKGGAKSAHLATPAAYLEHSRGPEMADLILLYARVAVETLKQPEKWAPSRLSSRERGRAVKLLKQLEPFIQRDAPQMVPLLDRLMQRWDVGMGWRGRRREAPAYFVGALLSWGAGDLGARGEDNLGAMELIAAAAAGGLNGVTWERRNSLLDRWRKLRKDYEPEDPDALKAAALERMKKEKEAEPFLRQMAMAAALRAHTPQKPTSNTLASLVALAWPSPTG